MKNSNGGGKIFKLIKIIAGLLLAADLVFMGILIFSQEGKISLGIILQIVAALCMAVLLIVTLKITAKREKKYYEEKKIFDQKTKIEKEREQQRIKRESNPPALDLDKVLSKVHPDLRSFVITNRNIKDYIPSLESSQSYIGTEPSLIDEYLPVNLDIDPEKECVPKLSASLYGLSYSLITPDQRGMYFKFLEKPYEKNVDAGYILMFFFGLERRLIYGGESGSAAELIGRFRRIHGGKTFLTLSFNALVYFCKRNDTFLDLLKTEYYNLNLDLTIYYHLHTDKIFPSEAMIRFKKYFKFPENAKEINPVLFKEEIDLLLGSDALFIDRNKKPVYSLEKYVRSSSVPRLENLPFPSNRSMDKLITEYFHPKHLYDMEPFKSEISELLSRAYMNVFKNHLDFPAKRKEL